MIWFILAWRNFIRNTRKSYFTLLIILVGTLAAIIAIGYMKATFMLVKEGTIKGGLGHIQIAKKDTFDGFEEAALQHGISATEANKIEDILTQHSNVQLILPRIKFQGLISRGNTSLVFIGEGAPNAPFYRDDFEPNIPNEINFDNVNADVLINILRTENNQLVLPNGTRYKMLVLKNCEKLSLKAFCIYLQRVAFFNEKDYFY
mgnify:CR=1 FL=1